MDTVPSPTDIEVIIYFQKKPILLKKHDDLGVRTGGSFSEVGSNLLYATLLVLYFFSHKALDLLRTCPFVEKLCFKRTPSGSTRSAFFILF